MLKTKEDFIKRYRSIHDSIFILEKKIEEISENKNLAIERPDVIINLKKQVEEIIEDLNKTREHERQLFNY